MNRLTKQVVVVTGASGLLGQQHTLAVLEEGGKVVMLDIDGEKLDAFRLNLPIDFAQRIQTYVCDIRDEIQIRNIARNVSESFGTITGLVNNAAINPSVEKNASRFQRFETLTRESWTEELDVGLWGSIVCSRVFGEIMLESTLPCSIVNVSSDHGLIAPMQRLYHIEGKPEKEQPVKPVTYSVVKHGLIGLTRYLATYWADKNIRVNALCPGGVENGQNSEFSDRFKAIVPLGRFARPDEYKGALTYLLSNESSYMTGSVMVVDGGRSVW
jgi:NAD(P)-dependent dehydrogenase (short-subunit alcohol dehydrogenase family)